MHVVNEIKINKIVLIFRNKYCYSFYLFYILFIKKKIYKNSIIFSGIGKNQFLQNYNSQKK